MSGSLSYHKGFLVLALSASFNDVDISFKDSMICDIPTTG